MEYETSRPVVLKSKNNPTISILEDVTFTGDTLMAFQLTCPEDGFMVQSDDRDEVMQMAKQHVTQRNHEMTDDQISAAIQAT